MAGGPADHESDRIAAIVAPAANLSGESLAAEILALFIEGHDDQPAALSGQDPQQQLGFARLELRVGQGALLFDFLELDRPGQAFSIVLVKLACRSGLP